MVILCRVRISIHGTERRILLERTVDQLTALGPAAIDTGAGQQIEVAWGSGTVGPGTSIKI